LPQLNKPRGLPLTRDTFGPFLTVVLSVPIAFLFGLGIQGDPSAYMIGLISLGVLTSLDLRGGFPRVGIGFVVSFLASLYVIGHSVAGQGFSPLSFGDLSLLLVALPPSMAVLVAGLLFSRTTPFKMIKANVVASVALAVGLGLGSAMKAGSALSVDSLTILFFVALGVAANIAQMVLFYFLDKMWRTKNLSMSMMPTAFFTFNLLAILGFVASRDLNQLYPFVSSLGFLPALALVGVGSTHLAQRMSSGPSLRPTITITGAPIVRQGKEQTIKIATHFGGHAMKMARIVATITRPGGKTESLKVSQSSVGEYSTHYRPVGSGSYAVRVSATSKERQTIDESFSFDVQPPQSSPPPPKISNPPQSHPSPPPPAPVMPAPIIPARPATPFVKGNLPRLDNWDPRVWVGQEVHSYKITELLATGLTGYVFRASFGQAGTEMAIKIPILRTGAGASALEETMSEATRLLELSEQSKYVVQLRGILVDRLNIQEIVRGDTQLYLRSPPAIVMELMKGGAAKGLLEDPSYDSLYYSEKWGGIIMLIGHMIASGLETIHNAGFVHLDVKPQNILFNLKPPATGQEMRDKMNSGTLIPKLADLGSAVRIGGKVGQFTSEYAPGEQVLGDSAASSMDIYALGATLYNMLTKIPVNSKKLIELMNATTVNPGKTANDLKSAWNSFNPDFDRIAKLGPAVPVLKKMLDKDPRKRPSAGSAAVLLRELGDKSLS
jgi:Protein kinase domain